MYFFDRFASHIFSTARFACIDIGRKHFHEIVKSDGDSIQNMHKKVKILEINCFSSLHKRLSRYHLNQLNLEHAFEDFKSGTFNCHKKLNR